MSPSRTAASLGSALVPEYICTTVACLSYREPAKQESQSRQNSPGMPGAMAPCAMGDALASSVRFARPHREAPSARHELCKEFFFFPHMSGPYATVHAEPPVCYSRKYSRGCAQNANATDIAHRPALSPLQRSSHPPHNTSTNRPI